MLFGWIRISELNEVRQKHALVMLKSLDEASPFHLVAARQQQVNHIRAVKAIAILHKCLAPELLLRRREARAIAEHLVPRRVIEPAVVHGTQAIAGVVKDVHERLARERL